MKKIKFTEMTKREQLLEETKQIVCKDRNKEYGEPEDTFAIIAKMWGAYLQEDINEIDVCNMMSLLKIARCQGGYKKDNFVDIAGYAACAAEFLEE